MIAQRITKEIGDTSRVIDDLTSWLDGGETITTVAPVNVTLGTAGWTTTPPGAQSSVPYDPTPVTVQSTAIVNSSTGVMLFLLAGTPGNTYTVTYVVWGSSGRKITREVTVQLTGAVYIPPNNPAPAGSQPAYVPLAGNVDLTGPLYLFEDPLAPAEAATKNYVDTLLATQIGAETTRAGAAETVLTTQLAAEVTRATAAETTLTTNLAAATTTLTAVSTAVSTETTARAAADTTLTTNLATEVARATAAEAAAIVTAATFIATQNVTVFRALSTTFTNTTGKVLFVSVQILLPAASADLAIDVNGGQVWYSNSDAVVGGVCGVSGVAMVPVGATYRARSVSSSPTIIWQETW